MGRISLSWVVTDRIPAMVWSEASVSTVIHRSRAQWHKTGAVEKAFFSDRNAVASISPKFQGVAFLHKFVSGRGSWEESVMKRQEKCANPRNDFTSCTFHGSSQPWIVATFNGSISSAVGVKMRA